MTAAAISALPAGQNVREDLPSWQIGALALAVFCLGDPFMAVHRILIGLTPERPEWVRYVWPGVYLIFLPFLALYWRTAVAAVARTPILLALAVLALISVAWSIAPDITARRAFAVFFWLAFAGIVASQFGWRALIRGMAWGFLALAVTSFVVALAFPIAGVMKTEHPGAWSGVWTHKNQLGGHMAMAVLVFAAAAWVDAARRRLWIGAVALAFALVLLSTSATALVSSLLALALIAFLSVLRTGLIAAVLALAAVAITVIAFFIVIAIAPDLLVGAIGRDLTFTGRTDIWRYLHDALEARPVLGYGYGVFWEVDTGPAWWVRAGLGWNVPSAHNGWVDLQLALGWVGIALFGATFVLTAARAVRAMGHPAAGVIAPGFVLLFLIQTLGEGYILEDNNLLWAMFTIVAIKLTIPDEQGA